VVAEGHSVKIKRQFLCCLFAMVLHDNWRLSCALFL